MDLFKDEKQAWLNKARHTAEKIAIRTGQVDIEDVLAECPRPKYLHPGITGHVFQNSGVFRRKGFKSSRRAISNGRTIRTWELRPELYPENVLVPEPPVREYGDTY